MSVSISWALTNGGAPISTNVSHGTAASGTTLAAKTLFLSHDGSNNITNCKLYLAAKATGYTGSATPTADLAEILGWGDEETANDFGGVQINMNATSGFPSGSWGTVTEKDPTAGWTFRTGVGDTSDNALSLITATGATAAGVIPSGDDPDVSLQIRVVIPNTVASTGTRQFDLRLKYTYTN